jgi:elongation factor P--beta-lysine ligase
MHIKSQVREFPHLWYGAFMKEEDLLKKIDALLDQLVKTAEELDKLSFQVISEEEIAPLQKKQDALVADLLSADTELKGVMDSKSLETNSPIRERIRNNLHHFQELNEHFIENLANSHGLIRFEINKIQKKRIK